MKISTTILGYFVSGLIAAPTDSYVVHERRDTLNSLLAKREAADSATRVPVRIALKQSNVELGEQRLMDVSDPRSARYGQHYTAEEIVDMFAPSADTIAKVKAWLVASNIPEDSIKLSNSKGWLQFETSAGELESLMKTKLHVYENVATRKAHFGSDEYHLPQDVAQHVDLVLPGITMLQMSKRSLSRPTVLLDDATVMSISQNTQAVDKCDTTVTPACISALYQIPPAPKYTATSNKMGIFETQGDIYSQEDIDLFLANATQGIPKGTGPEIHLINGASAPTSPDNAGSESNLDFDMAIPIIYPQQTALYQVQYPDNLPNFNYIFNDFLDAFSGPYCDDNGDKGSGKDCNSIPAPNVVSISWGDSEIPSLAQFYKRQCTEWMKLGMQGTSVFVASGDYGVAEGACLGPKKNAFVPDGLCGCPYITAVGSTVLPKGSKIGDPEIATTSFSSGGGFSNIFTTPDYQASAVSNYLTKHKPSYKSYNITDGTGNIPSSGVYNAGGRGYPDIAAIGDNGVYGNGGSIGMNGGTSMSCPIVAAIVNRINEERIHAGKKPLGFINPALYQAASSGAFNDITVGDQPGGGGCGTKGFSAAAGWDPVTGLGTPNYPKLLAALQNL